MLSLSNLLYRPSSTLSPPPVCYPFNSALPSLFPLP